MQMNYVEEFVGSEVALEKEIIWANFQSPTEVISVY